MIKRLVQLQQVRTDKNTCSAIFRIIDGLIIVHRRGNKDRSIADKSICCCCYILTKTFTSQGEAWHRQRQLIIFKTDRSRPHFVVYFCVISTPGSISTLLCLGFKPRAAGLQVQTDPLSYSGRPYLIRKVVRSKRHRLPSGVRYFCPKTRLQNVIKH